MNKKPSAGVTNREAQRDNQTGQSHGPDGARPDAAQGKVGIGSGGPKLIQFGCKFIF
jgi:hypothetical protein